MYDVSKILIFIGLLSEIQHYIMMILYKSNPEFFFYIFCLIHLQMVYLYQDPAGEKIFANTTSTSGSGGLGGNPFSDGSSGDSGKLKASKEKVANLEKKVQELELVLKEYQVIRNRENRACCVW